MTPHGTEATLHLLGCLRLARAGVGVHLPLGSQRLLSFLVLAGGAVRRDGVAGALWPREPEDRANTNLRSALARLSARAKDLVHADGAELSVEESLHVDLHEARAIALELISHPTGATIEPALQALPLLSLDLLPGWYDDWVVYEAEIWRQLRLHALEALSKLLTGVGRYAEAVVAAQAAVAGDPLRETAHAALIDVHLHEGNQSEALRAYASFRRRLRSELGLEPTTRLAALFAGRATVT